MKKATSILTMVLACGFAAPAFAASMSMEEIKARLEAQMDTKKIEPASLRTYEDEDGKMVPMSTSGYMAMPANASVMLDLNWRPGRSGISKAGSKQVVALCDAMKAMKNMPSIHLIGHSDSGGDADKNLAISQDRADAMRDHIAEECGIPTGLILTSSEGEAYAQKKPTSADRRIEVQLIGAPEPEAAPMETEATEETKENG